MIYILIKYLDKLINSRYYGNARKLLYNEKYCLTVFNELVSKKDYPNLIRVLSNLFGYVSINEIPFNADDFLIKHIKDQKVIQDIIYALPILVHYIKNYQFFINYNIFKIEDISSK